MFGGFISGSNPSSISTDPELIDIAGLTPSDGGFIVGNGSDFVLETGETVRSSLGLGELDSPVFSDVTIKTAGQPKLVLKDSDAVSNDENFKIQGNLTDTGDGTEDFDVALYAQVNGSLDSFFSFDADGNTTITPASGGSLVTGNLNFSSGVIATSSGDLDLTPLAGQDLNVNLSGSGDFVVATDLIFGDTSKDAVGIGTNSPNNNYMVTIASPGLVVNAQSGSAGLTIYRTLGSQQVNFNTDSATNYINYIGTNGLYIRNNTTNVLTLNNSSNVGIGGVSSTEKLEVVGNMSISGVYKVNGTQVVGNQGAAVVDATGGSTIDAEARTAINAVISRLEAHGLIAS